MRQKSIDRLTSKRLSLEAETIGGKHASPIRYQIVHASIGALIGLLLVHPVTMTIYWFEFNNDWTGVGTLLSDVLDRTFLSFDLNMWAMASVFIVLGAVIGLGSGIYTLALRRREHVLAFRDHELEHTLESLLASGESGRLEFKSSMRWDWKHDKINKFLEQVVVKTIAGFMNSQGGILVLGVGDDGTALGLEEDYSTLKLQNRDGYYQHVMHLVASRLSADLCHLISVRFQHIDDKDICIVLISASNQPAYVSNGEQVKYFLRTGNTTRELNTREAVAHIKERF